MDTEKNCGAFIVRINPGLEEALACNQAIIGWELIEGLTTNTFSQNKIRDLIFEKYCHGEKTKLSAGQQAVSVHRFFYEIKKDDYILIPAPNCFYIAQATEDNAIYLPEKVGEDSVYRRNLHWRYEKKAVPRTLASAALQRRLKDQHTVIDAGDLVKDIEQVLQQVEGKNAPTYFTQDLQTKLAELTLDELRNGKMNPDSFEEFIKQLLLDLGAQSATITPKNQDHGVDVLAEFPIGSFLQVQVAVQAKHYQPEPTVPASVVEQLIRGIEHQDFNPNYPVIGIVVTTGEFSEEAQQYAQKYMESEQCRCLDLKLIDGAELSRLVVENGINIH